MYRGVGKLSTSVTGWWKLLKCSQPAGRNRALWLD